jgi:hypothetical protein
MVKAMAMSTPDRDFHLGRALLHGVLGFAVFLVLAMAFVGTEPFGGSVARLAEAASKQAAWAFLLALLASYALQTSRRTLGGLVLLVMAGLLVFQLYALTRIAHARQDDNSPLTRAEREQPSPGAAGRLCQSALAFSFPAPDRRFAAVAARQGNLNDPYTTQWDWQDRRTGERLLVQAAKGAARNEASFRSFTAGVKRDLGQDAALQLGAEDLRWTEGSGEFSLSAIRGESGLLIETRCLSRMAEGETPPVLVCVEATVLQDADSLRQVRTGLSLAPCGIAEVAEVDGVAEH